MAEIQRMETTWELWLVENHQGTRLAQGNIRVDNDNGTVRIYAKGSMPTGYACRIYGSPGSYQETTFRGSSDWQLVATGAYVSGASVSAYLDEADGHGTDGDEYYGRDGAQFAVPGSRSGVAYIPPTDPLSASVSVSGTAAPGNVFTVSGSIVSPNSRTFAYSISRVYRAGSSGTWTSQALKSDNISTTPGMRVSVSATDTIPPEFGGYQVYYKIEASTGSPLHESTTAQSDTKNIVQNAAPTTPASLTVPSSIAGGSTITVSWGASTDSDGNLAGYILERSVDGGAWELRYRGSERTTTDAVAAGTQTVNYRVRAYDALNAESQNRALAAPVTVTNNQAPTKPASISVSPVSLVTGASALISWGASSDPDGDTFAYVLERAVDGSTTVWTEIYRGAALNYTDTVGSWSSVKYRIKAEDSRGASSDYRTSADKTVLSNTAPEINCEYADAHDFGVKNTVFSFVYSVGDADTGDTLTVKEFVDGAEKKSFTGARSTNYTFEFKNGSNASYWDTILDGTHTIRITVSDSKATAQRTFTFLKSVDGCYITMDEPYEGETGHHFGVAGLSVTGEIPDAGLTVEVTANASASSPTWERCVVETTDTGYAEYGAKTAAANDLNVKIGRTRHFLHKFATSGNAFNFRIQATKVEGVGGWIGSVSFVLTEIAPGGTQAFDPDAGFPA